MPDYIQSYKWKDGSDEILVTYNNKVTGSEVTNKKKKNNKTKKCKFLDKFKIPKNKNKDLY